MLQALFALPARTRLHTVALLPVCTACSQQYPLVEARLRDVGGRVAPINDGVKALKELHEYIRADQVR
jgi:hypothetical protein